MRRSGLSGHDDIAVIAGLLLTRLDRDMSAGAAVDGAKVTYRRAMKIAMVPWLISVASFVAWLVFDIHPTAAEVWDLSWRMAIVFACMYFGLAFTIFRINEIHDQAKSFRR